MDKSEYFEKLLCHTLKNLTRLIKIEVTSNREPAKQIKKGHFVLNRYLKSRCFDFEQNDSKQSGNASYEYQYMSQYLRYEPRVFMLYRILQGIEKNKDLITEEEIELIGMSLKQLKDWYQFGTSSRSVLAFLTGPCLVSCTFCSRKGTSPDHVLKLRPHDPTIAEINTRVKYYDPSKNRILFYTVNSVPDEILSHPLGIEVMKKVREKTDESFTMWTNGKPFTEENIKALKELMPIELDVSINSANPYYRRSIMNDKSPERAINSLKTLKEYGVPYSAGVVLWPTLPLEDVVSTIHYAIEQEAASVYLHLPAYSRYFNENEAPFDLEEVWSRYVEYLRPTIEALETPIWYSPQLYVENYFEGDIGVPRILGVLKNSPAYRAGIRKGDIILEINGLTIKWRTDAINMFLVLGHKKIEQFEIKIKRGNQILNFTLKLPKSEEDFCYPYLHDNPRFLGGIILNMTVDRGALKKLDELIRSCKAKEVLFLSSWLVRPHVEKLIDITNFREGKPYNLNIEAPENIYFGKNIRAGDLLVNSDFIACINKWKETGIKPDLIVIPSSPFTQWGRDLNGEHYSNIEKAVKTPVALLKTRLLDT